MNHSQLFHFRVSQKSYFNEAGLLGFNEFKTRREDVLKQIEKMHHYGFKRALMPYPQSEFDKEALKLLDSKGFDSLLVLNAPVLADQYEQMEGNREYLVLIDSTENLKIVASLNKKLHNVSVLFMPHRAFMPTQDEIHELGEIKYYFYYPLKRELRDQYLSTRRIKNYIENLRREGISHQPFPGLIYYENRSTEDMEFYPLLSPILEKRSHQVRNSFVIPVYNQKEELKKTLMQISCQRFDEPFEVIIVDDGSDDGLFGLENKIISELQSNENIDYTWIRHKRVFPREMGDGRFRAGISRNIGVSFARGENIHFLDSDVLVPLNYLGKMNVELQSNEIVQAKRYDLEKSFENWDQVDFKKDINLKNNPYWYKFFEKCVDWNQMSCPWKYVCTYGISLKKKTLFEVGLIRPNYIFYGFEDTDLGFQLYKQNRKFKLVDIICYHLPHKTQRSEFKNSKISRSRLLSKTAPVFFLNNLSPEIYYELRDFIFPSYSLFEWLRFILSFILSKPPREKL